MVDWKGRLVLRKLSFVGHSLGGIIIREAIEHLAEFTEFFHGYVSLGSPHLGFLYNSSTLIDAGMWLLKSWTQSACLKQLSMTDAHSFSDTFLFKLSQKKSLDNFKHIILVGSFQDRYAPCDSTRIQICSQALES